MNEHVIWLKHREIMATLVGQGNRRPFAENTGVPLHAGICQAADSQVVAGISRLRHE